MILNKDNFLDFDFHHKVIVFPTDTVYGIGCLYQDLESVNRIYDIKNRDFLKPMAILCASIDQVKSLIKDKTHLDSDLIRFWPGKLTLIFEKHPDISDLITSGMNTIGLRIPDDQTTLALLKKYGPMVVTSLNEANQPPILKFKDALKYESLVDYVIKGEDLNNQPSTVYDTINKIVLRQGDIIIE